DRHPVAALDQRVDHVRADEAGAACHEGPHRARHASGGAWGSACTVPRVPDRRLDVLLEGGSFFEGPRWRDGRWWVSDFYRHRVLTGDPDGREEEVLSVDQQAAGMGWTHEAPDPMVS